MADYITPDDLRDYIGSDTTDFAAHVQNCCTVASRGVEKLCDRYFSRDMAATARVFRPYDWYCVGTDDISTTTGLIVQSDDQLDGTYGTTWTINTDFTLEPANPNASGVTFPYNEIVATGSTKIFPQPWEGRRNTIKVTAQWGWPAVPPEVVHATRVAAAWLFKMKDAPDGFIGLDGWGPRFYKENPSVRALLAPYMRYPIAVA